MPEVMWWMTVCAYWGITALCIRTALKEQNNRNWFILSTISIMLALNKQFKLTSLFTRMLRKDAYRKHWYFERTELQLPTMGIIAVTCIGALFLLMFITKRLRWNPVQQFVLAAFIVLFSFALMRSASLHAIDAFLYRDRNGIQLNWIIELGSIAPVLFVMLWTNFWGNISSKK